MMRSLPKYTRAVDGGKFNIVDEFGTRYDGLEGWIMSGIMGFCGCGDPREALDLLHQVLEIIGERQPNADMSVWEQTSEQLDRLLAAKNDAVHPGLYWSYLYMLDSHRLIDHGGNIRGSWLTSKGHELVELLRVWRLEMAATADSPAKDSPTKDDA